ncbi:hypothetical protein ACC754_40040, partial [Rhizobium johnstonii]
ALKALANRLSQQDPQDRPENAKTHVPAVVRTKPVIYRVDMKDVSNLALMQRFQMMDGDIIYASNDSLVDFAKLFNVYQKSVPTAAAP